MSEVLIFFDQINHSRVFFLLKTVLIPLYTYSLSADFYKRTNHLKQCLKNVTFCIENSQHPNIRKKRDRKVKIKKLIFSSQLYFDSKK